MLETTSFWRNISITIFKFSPFLYTMKSYQIFQITNALIRQEKNTHTAVNEEKTREKMDFVLQQVAL